MLYNVNGLPECLCVYNCTQSGNSYTILIPDTVHIYSGSYTTRLHITSFLACVPVLRTMTTVLELLAALCLVKGGHEKIMTGIDNFKVVGLGFTLLFQTLNSHPSSLLPHTLHAATRGDLPLSEVGWSLQREWT